MCETSYVLLIKIHRDKPPGDLGLSQETYINKVLDRIWMKDCSSSVAPILKCDRFNLNKFHKTTFGSGTNEEHYICLCCWKSYMYAQLCRRPKLAFVVGILGRYHSRPRMDPYKVVKKVFNYFNAISLFIDDLYFLCFGRYNVFQSWV